MLIVFAIQVFRWSALAGGIAYGIYRQSTISAADKLRENANEYNRKQSLIKQAKQEFAKKNAPKDSKNTGMSSYTRRTCFLNILAAEEIDYDMRLAEHDISSRVVAPH